MDADLLSHDHGSEEIFFTQSLHVEGLDERIAMFDETILPTPWLLEALDLARGRRRLPAPTYVVENRDFEAVCAELAKLSLHVILLPGKGRTRTRPLTHWPRRSARNSASGSQRRRNGCAVTADSLVSQQTR